MGISPWIKPHENNRGKWGSHSCLLERSRIIRERTKGDLGAELSVYFPSFTEEGTEAWTQLSPRAPGPCAPSSPGQPMRGQYLWLMSPPTHKACTSPTGQGRGTWGGGPCGSCPSAPSGQTPLWTPNRLTAAQHPLCANHDAGCTRLKLQLCRLLPDTIHPWGGAGTGSIIEENKNSQTPASLGSGAWEPTFQRPYVLC